MKEIFATLQKAMNDYTLDRRGDVGSWVREETMRSYTLLVQNIGNNKLYKKMDNLMGSEARFYETYVAMLLQQLCEKIDRVREVAGKSLQTFFKFTAHKVCDFADKDKLTVLFMQE